MKYFIAIDSDSNRDLIVAKSKTDARKLYKKGKRRKSIETIYELKKDTFDSKGFLFRDRYPE